MRSRQGGSVSKQEASWWPWSEFIPRFSLPCLSPGSSWECCAHLYCCISRVVIIVTSRQVSLCLPLIHSCPSGNREATHTGSLGRDSILLACPHTLFWVPSSSLVTKPLGLLAHCSSKQLSLENSLTRAYLGASFPTHTLHFAQIPHACTCKPLVYMQEKAV